MLKLFLDTLLVITLFTPLGFFIQNKEPPNIYFFAKQLIFGVIIISFFAILLNFFTPLNKTINTIFLLLPLFLLFKFKSIYFKKEFIKFVLISSVLIFLLIVESNVYRPDAGLYHIPYINILNNEKIIFGLSNLHFRFAHTSIMQYVSAISNNLIFSVNGIVYAQTLVAVPVIISFLYQIVTYKKNKDYNFHFFYLLSVLIFIIFKMNRYGEYGNDAPSHFIFFFLISEILLIIKNNTYQVEKIINLFILVFFIITNKVILGLSILIVLLFIKFLKIKKLFKSKTFYFLIFFFIIWSIKNVIISGCLVFPVKSTCFQNLSWSNNNLAHSVSVENEAWSKGWPNYVEYNKKNNLELIPIEKYSKDFYWVKQWSLNHGLLILKIILPYTAFLLLLFLTLNKKKKLKNNYKNKDIIYIIIYISLFSTLYWLTKVPVFRYGYSYIIILISLIFSFSLINRVFYTKKNDQIVSFILIAFFAVFVGKNTLRIIKTDNNYNNYPWPKFYSMNNSNEKPIYKKIIINGEVFYMPLDNNGNYCMYSSAPCIQYGNYLNAKVEIVNGYIFVTKN